jgi:hypothetical protein
MFGVIGNDEGGILEKTLVKIGLGDKISFLNSSSELEIKGNVTTSYCAGAELRKVDSKYSLHYFHPSLPESGEILFDTGSKVPRKFGGYKEIQESRLSLFSTYLTQTLAESISPHISHEFILGFFPEKSQPFTQDSFYEAMEDNFSPLLLVIFSIPFINMLQEALGEKVSSYSHHFSKTRFERH